MLKTWKSPTACGRGTRNGSMTWSGYASNTISCMHVYDVLLLYYCTAPLYSQTGRQVTVVTQPSYTAAPSYHSTDDSAFYEGTQYHHQPTNRPPPVTVTPSSRPLYDMAGVSHSHQHYGNPVPYVDHHGATASSTSIWAAAAGSYRQPQPGGSHTHQHYHQQQQQQLYSQQQLQPEVYDHNYGHQHYQVYVHVHVWSSYL